MGVYDIWEEGRYPQLVNGPFNDKQLALQVSEDRTKRTHRTNTVIERGTKDEQSYQQAQVRGR
jgi:hypothetical protein